MPTKHPNTLEKLYDILDAIEPNERDCHQWPKVKSKLYGVFKLNKQNHRVSRLVLERKLGRPIRPGFHARATASPASIPSTYTKARTGIMR
jgi:hypothetical protein